MNNCGEGTQTLRSSVVGLCEYVRKLGVCAAIPFLLISCVMAPVPLVETEIQHPWSGRDLRGGALAIEAEQKHWYFPVLVSPEGAGKSPITTKCDYRYFLVQGEGKERVELTFLKLDAVDYSGWLIKELNGTSYLKAERISGRESEKEASPPPKFVQVDIVVFEGRQLKHRRTLTSLHWRGNGSGNEVWDRFKEEADGRYVTYKSTDGFRRYDVWKNVDEPRPLNQEAN